MKKIIITIIILALVGVGLYLLINSSNQVVVNNEQNLATTTPVVATTTPPVSKTETVIGKSVAGRDITAYHFGTGSEEILLVSGIHGGYAWNTALLGYQVMDYLKANPNVISNNLKVTVIPVLNPDGLFKVTDTAGRFTASDVSASQTVTVAGRYNGNTVDLNRNFACDWQAKGVWQDKTVSGGTAAFSEPESLAIKNYVEVNKPVAVIAYYSAAGGVYSSNCHNGISSGTKALTNTYAVASGYPAYTDFDFYATTGDMTNWLAKINISAVSVLLTNHTDTELTKNIAGLKAVIKSLTE